MSRLRFMLLSLILLVCIVFWSGLAVGDMKDNITYQGNKARITVGTIKDKADCSSDEARAIGEMLSTALANNDKFIVLASQEEVDELIDEIDLGESEYVESGRGPDKGLMEGADVLVTGAVTGFEPNAGGGGGALGGLTKKAFGAAGVSKKTAQINMDIKLIDIRTRRIIKAMSLEAKSSKWKAGAAGGGWTKDIAMAGALGAYSNEPMEDAIREVLRKAVNDIAKETPKEYFRYTGQGQYTAEYGASGSTGGGSGQAAAPATAAAATTVSAVPRKNVAEDMTLYTKYDFVPGDKVIFYDDMSNEEEGEFPYRWNLDHGVFEIARMGGEYWILCTDDGKISPKIPAGPLPKKYTVELEVYMNKGNVSLANFYIHWVDDKGKSIGYFNSSGSSGTNLSLFGASKASKNLSKSFSPGPHYMRIMATDRSIKCYFDQERVANVPNVEGFNPAGFVLRVSPRSNPDNPALFRGFRFAEGGKSMRDQLNESGRIVTHGILFDVNSYTIKGESYKTLKEIGELMQDDPALRLSIEGHTDSDGTDDNNMTLSQNRAESVRSYLIDKFGIGGDRLEAKGWGESKAIDSNETAEGKANNRRVELVKL